MNHTGCCATLVAALLALLATPARAESYAGLFDVEIPGGAARLSLTDDGNRHYSGNLTRGDATVSELAGELVVDEDDEAAVEGTLSGAALNGEFSFYVDDDGQGYRLLVMPSDDRGRPRLDLAAEYAVTRVAAESPAAAADVRRDDRLLGTWATQVVMSTAGGSMATQLFMEFRDDGRVIDLGSRAVGGIPGVGLESGMGGGGEWAKWQTRGAMLYVSHAGSAWMPLASYEVSGNRLLLTYYDGDRKLWHRQPSASR